MAEMDEILSDFTEKAVTKSIYSNLLDWSKYYARYPKITTLDTTELYREDIGYTDFSFQGVLYTNLTIDNVDEKIEEVTSYFTSHNYPFSWMVTSTTKPGNLDERLKAHGFKEIDGTPGMAVKLHELVDDREKPRGLSIDLVEDETSLRLWWSLWSRGYPMPKKLADFYADASVYIGVEPDSPMKYYIGYIDGNPIATSQSLLSSGVAGLYSVTVVPEARGKGIGTEMSLHPLRIARSLGYSIGVLDSTMKGLGIYQRLGFEEVCTARWFTYFSEEHKAIEEKIKDFLHTPRKQTKNP